MAGEFSTLARGLNLDQAQAQSLVDFYVAKTTEAAEAPYQAYADMRRQWQDAVKADPEIGGSKLPATKSSISRVIDTHLGRGPGTLGSAFREAMDLTGAGDNPAFIKAFAKLASLLGEGTAVTGNAPSRHGQAAPGARPASAASALWPTLPA